jgi:hypothetical protein
MTPAEELKNHKTKKKKGRKPEEWGTYQGRKCDKPGLQKGCCSLRTLCPQEETVLEVDSRGS